MDWQDEQRKREISGYYGLGAGLYVCSIHLAILQNLSKPAKSEKSRIYDYYLLLQNRGPEHLRGSIRHRSVYRIINPRIYQPYQSPSPSRHPQITNNNARKKPSLESIMAATPPRPHVNFHGFFGSGMKPVRSCTITRDPNLFFC